MGRADDMSYIGEYMNIASSGHIEEENIYPASLILGAIITLALDITANNTSFIVPVLFSFIFITGTYVYSKKIIQNSYITSLVIPSSFIMYLGVYNFLNVPHAFFFAYMPLFLYVFHSYIDDKNKFPFSLIFILIILLIPFTHPFIVYFVTVYCFVHIFFNTSFLSRFNKFGIAKMNWTVLSILFVSYTSWFLYQGRLLSVLVRDVYNYINDIGRGATSDRTVEKIASINFEFNDYLQLLSIFYGRYVFPTIIIIIGFAYIFFKKKEHKYTYIKKYYPIIILYIICIFTQVILMFNPVITHQPDRLMHLNFVVYGQIPLFAISLYVIFLEKQKSFYKIINVCLILLAIWTFSLFAAFDSPNVYRTNSALTYNEIEGMDWLLKSQEEYPIPIGMVSEQSFRYPDILGLSKEKMIHKKIIDHFGYNATITNFSEVYFDSKLNEYNHGYLVITTLGELLYQEIPGYNRIERFKKKDFEKIRNDHSTNKIYDSLNIEIFVVNKL
ncbi:hypothetical protein [Methanolobus tindarius]|nr:hypothetical protein [Methanolobus tindarius]